MASDPQRVREFLAQTSWAGTEPTYLAGDASARRYFRLGSSPSAVLMDATNDASQSIGLFVAMTEHLRSNLLSAPKIYAEDRRSGFLLLEDLGDAVFAREIDTNPSDELMLYRAAKDVLVAVAELPALPVLPTYTAKDMAEMIWPAFEWYRWGLVGDQGDPLELVTQLETLMAPMRFDTLSLRDFHAENLIWLPDRDGTQRVGLLDYQDAMIGPPGYDLVSLLHDARRDVSPSVIETIQAEFAHATNQDPDDFAKACALLSLQRNLRILGVFTRLALKFDKPRYLDFIPRVWRYVESSAKHPELGSMANLISKALPEPSAARLERIKAQCGTIPDQS